MGRDTGRNADRLRGKNSGSSGVQSKAPKGSISARMRVIASQKRWSRVRVAPSSCPTASLFASALYWARAYPRLRQFKHWHRWSARRALLQVAVIVGRNRFGRGRPNLWVAIRDSTCCMSIPTTSKATAKRA